MGGGVCGMAGGGCGVLCARARHAMRLRGELEAGVGRSGCWEAMAAARASGSAWISSRRSVSSLSPPSVMTGCAGWMRGCSPARTAPLNMAGFRDVLVGGVGLRSELEGPPRTFLQLGGPQKEKCSMLPALPIVGGLVSSVIGILTGTVFGIAPQLGALLRSLGFPG